jgi:hypothetical protein
LVEIHTLQLVVLVETHTLVIDYVQVRVQVVELVGLQQVVAVVTERVDIHKMVVWVKVALQYQ